MKKLLLLLLCVPLIGLGQCISGDCENGYGTYTFASGDKYVGEFKDGRPQGKGTKIYANGKVEEGRWENGTFILEK